MHTLRCEGCGATIAADSPSPFRCPNAGDGADHVVARALDAAGLAFPRAGDANPFVRYGALSFSHALARSKGLSDADFDALVRALDAAVARVWGRGFVETPCAKSAELAAALGVGAAWVKDETGNVSGSHKARHLMGLAILGAVHARVGIGQGGGGGGARLAIASCGNAALAAAVVAAAWGRPLDVFIPNDANPRVVDRLGALGASIHVCARTPGVAGDPCYHAFRKAVADGALPFCCQGSDNGLTIEGGETLGYELVTRLLDDGAPLDRLFVQVGGGALASATVQAFRDAAKLGAPIAMPKLHAVQTRGAFPLRRAWEVLARRLGAKLSILEGAEDSVLAAKILRRARPGDLDEALAYAAQNRAEFMWPWEDEPKSVAHGILDDETYDWLAIVRGMIESGGWPVVVDEARLVEANALGRSATGIDADETGTSGLAGAIELARSGVLGASEAIAVIFSGVRR
jgi:threonine synthase